MAWTFRSTSFEAEIDVGHPGLLLMGRTRDVFETPILGVGVNQEIIQLGDWKNFTLKIKAWCDAVTRATLEGLADGTSGTLSGVASISGSTISYTGVYLVNVEPMSPEADVAYRGTAVQEFMLTFKKLGV